MNLVALLVPENTRMRRVIRFLLLAGLLLYTVGCRRSDVTPAEPTPTASAVAAKLTPSVSATPPARAGSAEPSLRQAKAETSGRAFLWRATSASAVVYLLGSIHVARADLYPLAPRIEAAFDEADVLVLEVVLNEAERTEAAQKLARAGTYGQGDSLERHLDPVLLGRVLGQAGDVGSQAHIQRFEPWFLSQLLLMSKLEKLGYREDLGIDRYFQERARGRMRVEAIETLDEQVALLDGMSADLQTLMLDETLSELQELEPTMRTAFDAWKRGDTGELERVLMKSIDDPRYASLKKRLFSDRNRRMTAQVERRLSASGTWFVVVGSGHLVGDDGIVSSLKRRNVRIEQW